MKTVSFRISHRLLQPSLAAALLCATLGASAQEGGFSMPASAIRSFGNPAPPATNPASVATPQTPTQNLNVPKPQRTVETPRYNMDFRDNRQAAMPGNHGTNAGTPIAQPAAHAESGALTARFANVITIIDPYTNEHLDVPHSAWETTGAVICPKTGKTVLLPSLTAKPTPPAVAEAPPAPAPAPATTTAQAAPAAAPVPQAVTVRTAEVVQLAPIAPAPRAAATAPPVTTSGELTEAMKKDFISPASGIRFTWNAEKNEWTSPRGAYLGGGSKDKFAEDLATRLQSIQKIPSGYKAEVNEDNSIRIFKAN